MKKILAFLFLVTAFVMQANGQVEWTKYTGNPVFPRNPDGRYFDSQIVTNPHVTYDGSTYHMWYSGYDGVNGGAKTGYAYSTDGTNWIRHTSSVLEGGDPGSWDAVTTFQPCVLKNDTTYHMWYCGHDGSLDDRQIGYATSPDPIHWSKYGNNPVLTPGPSGSWDDLFVESPEVLFIDGVYHMWYSGGDDMYWQIGHATSLDGINWMKDTLNPVLRVGAPGSWDEQNVIQPSVVFDGTLYHMWYSGGVTAGWDWKTGYAYSLDGRNWIKVSVNNPVMGLGDPGSWDDTFAGVCSVTFDANDYTFKMWYGGGNGVAVGDIGYATAPKASFDFKKNPLSDYPTNPIFPRGETEKWDNQFVSGPSILYDGKVYHMWYSGNDGSEGSQTGYAYSLDGINWIRFPNYVVPLGSSGSWDGYTIIEPTVLFDNNSNTYKMWFSGHDGDYAHMKIGYATSPDSVHWTVYSSKPVLTPGPSGSWDDLFVESPEVLNIDGVYHMWYGGTDGAYFQIGHATSPDGITWEKDSLNPVLKVGSAGSWDAGTVNGPCVLFDGIVYHMLYGGAKDDGWGWETGYAYSYDGRHWIKDITNNPVLSVGSAGSWDALFAGIGGGAAMFVDDEKGQRKLKLWYGGGNGVAVGDIGYATDLITSVKNENLNVIPNEFSLTQNYPNPFNPTTKIRYQVPTRSLVSIRVYNLLGKVVETLVNEEKPVGTYELTWNAENLSSGVYFYQLQAGSLIQTKKMILLK